MKHVDVRLPNGGVMSLDYEDAFLDNIRKVNGIPEGEDITDEQIRMFVYSTMKSALDKHEMETRDAEP